MSSFTSLPLITDATAQTTGNTVLVGNPSYFSNRCIFARMTGTAPFTASIGIEYSLDGTNFDELDTISLSNTNDKIGIDVVRSWPFVRAVVKTVTGTITAINVDMAY